MATTTTKIIRILQRRIFTQRKLELATADFQMEMHQTFFEVCDMNDSLIKENADLRRKLEKRKK